MIELINPVTYVCPVLTRLGQVPVASTIPYVWTPPPGNDAALEEATDA